MENGHLATVLQRIHETLDRMSDQMDRQMGLISSVTIEQARLNHVIAMLENRIDAIEQKKRMGDMMTPHLMLKFLLMAAIAGMMVMEWIPADQIGSLILLAK
jgi:hypothetical protein